MFKLTSQLILLTRVWIKYTRPLNLSPGTVVASGGLPLATCPTSAPAERAGKPYVVMKLSPQDNQLSQYCIPNPYPQECPTSKPSSSPKLGHPGNRMVLSIRKTYIHTSIYITFLFLTFKYKNTTTLLWVIHGGPRNANFFLPAGPFVRWYREGVNSPSPS